MRAGPPWAVAHAFRQHSRLAYCTASVEAGRRYTKHYLNLSNGVEALDGLLTAGLPSEAISFCRIQSSQCESQDYNGLLSNLDHDMMIHLALGHECRVYDFGSRGAVWIDPDGTSSERYVPRAIWWGLEWWRYALNNLWELPTPRPPLLRGVNVERRFREALCALPKKQRTRLKYYRAFTADGLAEVRLLGYYAAARTDGDRAAHRSMLLGLSRQLNEKGSGAGQEPEAFGMSLHDPLVMSGRVPMGRG